MRVLGSLILLAVVLAQLVAIASASAKIEAVHTSLNLADSSKKSSKVLETTPNDHEGSGDLFGSDTEDYTELGSGEQDDEDEDEKVEEVSIKPFGETTTTKKEVKDDDIHFAEEGEDNDLYEYYAEYYDDDEDYDIDEDEDEEDEDEDDDDDDIYYDDDEDEDEDNSIEDDVEVIKETSHVVYESSPPVVSSEEVRPSEPFPMVFSNLSYIYVILASAVISFSLAILVFFLCRRSRNERRHKRKLLPFILNANSDAKAASNLYYQPVAVGPTAPPSSLAQSPIVKSQHRVPTSTRDFLHRQNDATVEGLLREQK